MKKILVVDDIGEYIMVLEMYFPSHYASLSAYSMDEAKEVFAKESDIALAIVDVRLRAEDKTDISGLELLSWIKKEHPQTQVIMISAYHGSEYAVEALGRGAYAFLDKPLQPAELKKLLGEILQ